MGQQGVDYHETKRHIPEDAYPWVAKLRSEKISPLVRPDDVVLEYGVGFGWNLARVECQKKIGLDISEHLEEAVTSHGIEFITEIDEVEDTSVNVVLCHHVLEHIYNPSGVLEDIRGKLCLNGKLLLFVPFERERRYRYFNPDELNHHLYSWNVQTMSNLVRESGFKILSAHIGSYGYARFAAVWSEKLKLGEFGFRSIRRIVGLINPLLEVRIIAEKAPS